MNNRFFQLALAVLFFHQLGKFLLSLSSSSVDDQAYQVRSPPDQIETYHVSNDEDFSISQFNGIANGKERRQRLGNLRSACSTSKSSKILKNLNVKERSVLLKHIIVSDKYKFLYCYTPKVACSNWKRVVMVLDGVSDGFVKDHPHGLKYLYQYSSKEIDYRLKNYFKFTFVRNPLERLLSAYRNKFGEIEDIMRTYGVKIKKRYGKSGASQEEYTGKIPGDDVSFEEFIRFLLDNSVVENMNEHWAPMHILCQPCVVDYDFIGSYDNLYEDSEKVLQQIKAPKDLHFPTRQSYYSPSSLSTTAYYYSVVNNTYLESLFAKYYQDFALFSYPFPKIK